MNALIRRRMGDRAADFAQALVERQGELHALAGADHEDAYLRFAVSEFEDLSAEERRRGARIAFEVLAADVDFELMRLGDFASPAPSL